MFHRFVNYFYQTKKKQDRLPNYDEYNTHYQHIIILCKVNWGQVETHLKIKGREEKKKEEKQNKIKKIPQNDNKRFFFFLAWLTRIPLKMNRLRREIRMVRNIFTCAVIGRFEQKKTIVIILNDHRVLFFDTAFVEMS